MPEIAYPRQSSRAHERPRKKRPLLKSARFWVPTGLVVGVLVAGGVAGAVVVDHAMTARDELQAAIPLATQAKDQILDGDTEAAQQTVAQLREHTSTARQETSGAVWRTAEVLPVVGANLSAVRTLSSAVDGLVDGALEPASHLSITQLAPVDGRIDTGALDEASDAVSSAARSLASTRTALNGIDREALIDQVASGVTQLDDAISQIEPLIGPAEKALDVLPDMLGADEARNYLVMVQNNAESRGTGGNPAALVVLHTDDGRLSISGTASSTDFHNGRENPITEISDSTLALYGDKIGRWMMNVTLTPDFPESAKIMEAFWNETYPDIPIDGTISIDPVALSYLMAATGPVQMPDGVQLTSDNAVQMLLNDVYFRYPENAQQDAYFAFAASGVFDALTSVQDPQELIKQATRAIDEGRVLYAPKNGAEAELIAGTRLEGKLPVDNTTTTLVGAYVNDETEGKLDYYLDTAVDVQTDVCEVSPGTAPTFTVASTLTSTLQPDQVEGLAHYISPARFYPKGHISTDLVLYGPVGATFDSATIDGEPVEATAVEHLGRPAVMIRVLNEPGTQRAVSAQFTGASNSLYGPVEAWHTPMVRETPVTIDAPGCGG